AGVVATVSVLIGVLAAWILAPGWSVARLLFAVAATLPLWALLPGLARGHRRTHAATSLCVVPYLVIALMELIANPDARWWASSALCASFVLFVFLIAYLRV